MDGPIFDAMLKTALEEALREDMKDLEQTPAVRQSRRQKKRMKKMLADPWGYRRRCMAAEDRQPSRRPNPARWLAVVVVAALLTGTAAGYALRGGDFFQKMFDSSPWAAAYGDAADTEQLLDMGSESLGAVVQDETLRLELLDAVSDGQFAMAAARLTVLDQAVLRAMGQEFPAFMETDIYPVDGSPAEDGVNYGLSVRPWKGGERSAGQYFLIFSIDTKALADGGDYRIDLKDLVTFGGEGPETLASGTWTLQVSLRPGEVRTCYPERICEIGGADWVLERMTVSALALKMEFSATEETELSLRGADLWLDPVIHVENGRSIGRADYVCGISGSPDRMDVTLEFQMPVNVEKIKSVTVCGQEIVLED